MKHVIAGEELVALHRAVATAEIGDEAAGFLDQQHARRDLSEALIATGIPYKAHGDLSRFDRILNAVSPEVAGIRRFGSAALDLAWVAAGRFDGFWEEDLQLWDIAAGIVLVREAGGFVSDFRGAEAGLANGQILAANNQLHSRLHKLVAGALRT